MAHARGTATTLRSWLKVVAKGALLKQMKSRGAQRFAAFLLSNFVQKGGQLLLLAGLIYVGTIDDVYRFGLFISLFNLIVPIFSINIHTAIGRVSFDIPDEKRRHDFILSCLAVGFCTVAGGLVILSLTAWGLGIRDELTGGRAANYGILLVATLVFVVFQFFTVLLRLEERARPFTMFGMITGIGALGFSATAFLLGTPAFLAAVIGYSGAQFIAALYALASTKRVFEGARPSLLHLRAGYAYSIGTVLFAVVQWITNYSGRWLAADWLSRADLAAYTLLGQFLVALTMTLGTLYESRRPEIIRDFAAGERRQGIRKIDKSFTLSVGLVGIAFLTVAAMFPFQFELLPAAYEFRLSWIASAGLQGIAYAVSMRMYWLAIGTNQTTTFAGAAITGAAVNLASVFTLGPLIGVNGLLLAAAFGLLTQAAIAWILLTRSTRERPERC